MNTQLPIDTPEQWVARLSFNEINWHWNWTLLWFYVYHQYEIAHEDLKNFQEALLMMGANAKERKIIRRDIDLVWRTWREEKFS